MSDDPFDDIDPDEREGDPFADLEESVGTDADDVDPEIPPADTGEADPQRDATPADTGEGDPWDDAPPAGTGGDPDTRVADDPFSGADADETAGSGPAGGEPAGTSGEPAGEGGEPEAFGEAGGRRRRREKIEVDEPFADFDVRPEEDAFESGDWGTSDVDADVWEDLSTPTEPEATTEAEGARRYSEVNKHSFCEQCEYFSGPPDISCTHEGTEILKFLDMETVEVVDCPVVEERKELGDPGNWQ